MSLLNNKVYRLVFMGWSLMSGFALAEGPSTGALGMAESVRTVGGLLEVRDSLEIGKAVFLNGKQIPGIGNSIVSLDYRASIAGNDVVIVNEDAGAGSGCYGNYSFVTITPRGQAAVGKQKADSCDAKIVSTPTAITITSIEHDGRRTKTTLTTYTKDGVTQSR